VTALLDPFVKRIALNVRRDAVSTTCHSTGTAAIRVFDDAAQRMAVTPETTVLSPTVRSVIRTIEQDNVEDTAGATSGMFVQDSAASRLFGMQIGRICPPLPRNLVEFAEADPTCDGMPESDSTDPIAQRTRVNRQAPSAAHLLPAFVGVAGGPAMYAPHDFMVQASSEVANRRVRAAMLQVGGTAALHLGARQRSVIMSGALHGSASMLSHILTSDASTTARE